MIITLTSGRWFSGETWWNHVCRAGLQKCLGLIFQSNCYAQMASVPRLSQTLGSSYKGSGSEFGWLVTVVSVAVGIDSQGEFLSSICQKIMVILLVPKVYGQTRGNLSFPNLWFGVIALPVSTFDFEMFTARTILLGWDHAKVWCIYGRTIGNPHLILRNVRLA